MGDRLAAGIVHLAVDPTDVESLMAIRASSMWASEHSIPLKIWPFQRELGNPAADVPRGDTAMERLKARRALARANYRQMEERELASIWDCLLLLLLKSKQERDWRRGYSMRALYVNQWLGSGPSLRSCSRRMAEAPLVAIMFMSGPRSN